MPEYDFHQLSPHDLEHLVRDLLQAHWSKQLESFKTGRDGGIDLRHSRGPDNLIVQVKHYLRTGLAGLIRDLKREDAKLANLSASRYVVATSVPLSPQNKEDIITALPSAPLVVSDIYGQDDLNNLLGTHPLIEQNHPKLWLTSRSVLDRVLHNAEITRSALEVERIHQTIRLYVQTDAFRDAENRLSDQSVVMVSGPPGVGKTTLANMLLYEHLSQGWQAVVIDRDVSEGAKLFQKHFKQVFYFDDFVGATLLGEGVSATDKALLAFIALVRDDSTSRLILTTRDHLYEQAITRSERLRQAGLDAHRVVLHMPRYTTQQRAQILYNHIFFSDLPSTHVAALLEGGFYRKIIHHRQFNPRIIEWLSSYQRIRNVAATEYKLFVKQLLDNPVEIWRHAYEEELTDAARSLLLALWSLEGKSSLARLRVAFSKIHTLRAQKYGFERRPHDFSRAQKELSGSFARLSENGGLEIVDPSVLDFIATALGEEPENVVDFLLGASSFNQVQRLWIFSRQNNGATAISAWHEASREAASVIEALMLECRRVSHADGSVSRHGPTYERRLAIVLEIARWVGTDEYRSLIEPIVARLLGEPLENGVDIGALVDVVVSLDDNSAAQFSTFVQPLRGRVFDAVEEGCDSYSLREAIRLLDDPPEESDLKALRAGYSRYLCDYFSAERWECGSNDQFDSLIEDLTVIGKVLSVETKDCVAEVEESRDEFEESEERYADIEEDEYRERGHQERHLSESIADMFNGLRDDRMG